ncbi:hypothetical protein ABFT80_14455 [Mesorhizobium sp. SB112]|uniref:DUF7256 domain-containing protein n=1 Tax=Mesorhizobium sp. SB112 TaxID=3151853 RepID=UPI003263495D
MPDDEGVSYGVGLARLRPGMSTSDVAAALGAHWRTPAPHKGGIVDTLENSHGVVVHLDKKEAIGRVSFDWRFQAIPIEGVQMGMTMDEARKALPDLEIGDDFPMMRGVREGVRKLPDGVLMRVRFTLEKINAISFSANDAEYREAYAPPYASPSGRPGAPFADVNFKLIVLSSLVERKALNLGTPQDLASHVLQRDVDLEEEGYDLMPEVLDYLARYPLTEEMLAQVDSIRFDAGNKLYRFAWHYWGGADDTFDVSDMGGIDLCPNITSVSATSMIERTDIRKLSPLAHLTHLSISTAVDNLEALRDLKALKQLRLLDNRTYADAMTPAHPTRALFEEVKTGGVTVWLGPSSWTGDRPPPFE